MDRYENLGLIVAMGRNREIGYNNDLIWRIKEDLDYFKTTTMGSYMIMGRKTYDSMPKNLPGRKYIVLSRSGDLILDSSKILHRSVEETLDFVSKSGALKFYVVGGSTIYKEFLPYVSHMHITEIDDEFSLADTYFPPFKEEEWLVSYGKTKDTQDNLRYRHTLRLSLR